MRASVLPAEVAGSRARKGARRCEASKGSPVASLCLALIVSQMVAESLREQGDHAWRKQAVAAMSVDEIQRREQWEAEEREALLLLEAVYGKDAMLADAAQQSSFSL